MLFFTLKKTFACTAQFNEALHTLSGYCFCFLKIIVYTVWLLFCVWKSLLTLSDYTILCLRAFACVVRSHYFVKDKLCLHCLGMLLFVIVKDLLELSGYISFVLRCLSKGKQTNGVGVELLSQPAELRWEIQGQWQRERVREKERGRLDQERKAFEGLSS